MSLTLNLGAHETEMNVLYKGDKNHPLEEERTVTVTRPESEGKETGDGSLPAPRLSDARSSVFENGHSNAPREQNPLDQKLLRLHKYWAKDRLC